jgi:Fe-S-cluster containining protein
MKSNKMICLKCNAKCCKLATVFFSKDEKSRIEKKGFENFCKKHGKFFEMKNKAGICIFLKGSLCKIYDVKPEMCSAWPVYPIVSGNKKNYIVLNCALSKKLKKEDISKLKVHARKIPRKYATYDLTGYSPLIKKRFRRMGWKV